MGDQISLWARRRWHREVERRYGRAASEEVKRISDSALGYYGAYLYAGIDHAEALRLALLSARMGDDITNYPDLAYPEGRSVK